MRRDPLNGSWSGRVVERARAQVKGWMVKAEAEGTPLSCGKCKTPVLSDGEWAVGHIKSRLAYPELTMEPGNWWPEHRKCSDGSSHEASREKGRRDAIAALGVLPVEIDLQRDPALPVSPSEDLDEPIYQPSLPISLPFPTSDIIDVRPGLDWDPEALLEYPWLAEFAIVPDDASPPLYMSLPVDDAVGSYGAEAIAWIEAVERKTLRWWQRLAITRQLEHREDGSLCYEEIVESASRRSGKSLRMRGMALWRVADPLGLFNETQLVMHTGSDLNICREIQRGAWVWARAQWGAKSVTVANGKESIERPDNGSRWLTRAQDAVYGYDVTYGMVDEGWNVKPDTVSEGIEPATLERHMPQIHKTSTAHRRATSLMRASISTALAIDDPSVLLLVWAAPAGSDPAAEATWRAASPYWSEARRKLIARKYEKALAGEVDPEADDPDPMAGFTAQYLNMWRLKERVGMRGDPIVDEDAWSDLAADRPDETPTGAAIESWFADGVSLALAYTAGREVVVSVTDHDTVEAAVAALKASGFRQRVTVGSSLKDDPSLKGVAKVPGEGRAAMAAGAVKGLLREQVLRHDGGEHLTGQVLAVRTLDGTDGPRMVSNGRGDAVKAAVWAVRQARPAATKRKLTTIVV